MNGLDTNRWIDVKDKKIPRTGVFLVWLSCKYLGNTHIQIMIRRPLPQQKGHTLDIIGGNFAHDILNEEYGAEILYWMPLDFPGPNGELISEIS